jgi:ferrous iron transport protein B
MNRQEFAAAAKEYAIALAGNPYCGKTTYLTPYGGKPTDRETGQGLRVERKDGWLLGSRNRKVVDLPGISTARRQKRGRESGRDYILSGEADLIVNIVDAVIWSGTST